MPNPKSIAGALSKAVKGAKAAPKKVMPARSGFDRGSMDDLIHQLTLGGKNDDALKQQLVAMAGNNPAKMRRVEQFGLEPPTYGPEAPLGRYPEAPKMFPEAPAGRYPEGPAARFPEAPAGRYPEAPQGRYPELPEGFTPPTAKPSGMMAGLMNHKGKAAAGAAGAAGLGFMMSGSGQPKLMASHDSEEVDSTTEDPYNTSINDARGLAAMAKSTPKPRMGKGLGVSAKPKVSGLTGQNGQSNLDLSSLFGASPEWEQTLGSVDDSLESSQGSLDAYNQSMEEPEQGGGFGELLKKIGPLLAALFAGKMMR